MISNYFDEYKASRNRDVVHNKVHRVEAKCSGLLHGDSIFLLILNYYTVNEVLFVL